MPITMRNTANTMPRRPDAYASEIERLEYVGMLNGMLVGIVAGVDG